MILNDNFCTKLLMNDCIVFVCEFIEVDSCLIGANQTVNSEFVCFYVLLQTICQMVKIDPIVIILNDLLINGTLPVLCKSSLKVLYTS